MPVPVSARASYPRTTPSVFFCRGHLAVVRSHDIKKYVANIIRLGRSCLTVLLFCDVKTYLQYTPLFTYVHPDVQASTMNVDK